MDFEKLLNPVAEYFDFLVDFVTLDGISRFTRLGSVSPKLVSFLVLGMVFGFVIKRAKGIPSFGQDVKLTGSANPQPEQPNQSSESVKILESPDLFLLLLFQINGALFFHLSLVIVSKFHPLDFGNFKDSLNATLAVSAIQNPLQAILHKLLTFILKIQKYDKKTKVISVLFLIFYIVMTFVPAYYFFRVLAIIHRLPSGDMIAPTVLTFFFVIVMLSILFYFIRVWQKVNASHP